MNFLSDKNRRLRFRIWVGIVLMGMGLIFYSLFSQTKELLEPSSVTIVETLQDRILVLAPHPDDDILGCAGVIQKAKKLGIPVRVVYLTYGDANEWAFLLYRKRLVFMPKAVRLMGEVRHSEAIKGAEILGLSQKDLIFLGYPDFGTMNIWYRHWDKESAYKSLLTKVKAVPYSSAYRPGADYKGEDIIKDLESTLRDFKPTKIFVSHPGDHNGDHRALYLFTKIALWDLRQELKAELYPYIIHFKFWPKPPRYHPELALQPPSMFTKQISWNSIDLDPDEVQVKEKALRAHRSQYKSSGLYLNSFIRSNEIFGDFPIVKINADRLETRIPSDSKEDIFLEQEQLTDEERVSFVGFQERTIAVRDGNLEVNIRLSRPLGETVGASIYIFGYRRDIPFEMMPKIHVKMGAVLYDVFDQRKKISERLIKIKRHAKRITIIVPLNALGNPDQILTSAQTYLGKVPLDWLSWRVIELNDNK